MKKSNILSQGMASARYVSFITLFVLRFPRSGKDGVDLTLGSLIVEGISVHIFT